MRDLPSGTDLISPPADTPELLHGEWAPVLQSDPVAAYIRSCYRNLPSEPRFWRVSRRSRAVYTYRELRSGWAIAAKFYGVKTNRADKYALQEFDGIVKAREMGLSAGPIRAVRPLGHWGSVLFLEQVDGPTLEDVISVRHSSPGLLRAAVEAVSRLLARLHGNSAYPARRSQFEPSAAYAYKVVDDLSNHGVLWQDSVLQDALFRLIKRWATHPNMMRFVPSLIHGDVTTSNLIFPDGRTGVVAIDWERSQRGDPAEDLGRFLAEVTHSLSQHGGTAAEARSLIEHILGSYTQALPGGPDPEMLQERARFFRAVSALRIARNGWVPKLDRIALVGQAMALLARPPEAQHGGHRVREG